ncbi:MAG: hypothetical protein Q8P50_00065 [Bacillota bacterium]|nr:hypothetical protein [Bacillota bacterium]
MPWIRPVAAEMFVGNKLRFLDKLVATLPVSPLRGMTAHDDRDWGEIRAWTDAVHAALKVEQPAVRP